MSAPCPDGTRPSFANVDHLVELRDGFELREALANVMPDWRLHIVQEPVNDNIPHTRIRRGEDGSYQFRSCWSQHSINGLGIAGATCGVVADLTQAYLDAQPGILGLHCGAVRIGGHLIAFTGTYRTGKTTLVTRLGAEPDYQFFCDDVLPIMPDGSAVALGVQPRLRLPLPCSISPTFRAFIKRNLTVNDKRYGFVSLPHQAPYGTQARLEALVVLSRQDKGPAQIHRISTSEAAAYLIRQNIADPGDAETHYDMISAMAEGLPSILMTYSDLEEAAGLIRQVFSAPSIHAPDIPASVSRRKEWHEPEVTPADLDCCFTRAPHVSERVIGTDIFLWQMDSRHFFSLNPVGGAVWMLLEHPTTGHEIVETVAGLFPDACPDNIATDVARLLGQMQARDLVFT